jgi:hypothetical protein
MKRNLSLGLMLALSFAGSAMAGHRGSGYSSGCCCQGGAVYSQPAVPAGTVSAAPAGTGYRSYSYQPSASGGPAAAAVAAPVVVAPAAVAPAATGYSGYTMPSMYRGYLGAGYNPPASVRGMNGAAWKQSR